MSEVLTAHRLESILRGDQFANVEVLVILAHDAALRAALKKAEEENERLGHLLQLATGRKP